MKYVAYYCREDEVISKVEWIENQLGFEVVNVKEYSPFFIDDRYRIVFKVNKDDRTFLKLKYPGFIFEDLSWT